MLTCTHCGGQVLGGQCLQCSREVAPRRINEEDRIALLTRVVIRHERHSRPLPLAEHRIHDLWRDRR